MRCTVLQISFCSKARSIYQRWILDSYFLIYSKLKSHLTEETSQITPTPLIKYQGIFFQTIFIKSFAVLLSGILNLSVQYLPMPCLKMFDCLKKKQSKSLYKSNNLLVPYLCKSVCLLVKFIIPTCKENLISSVGNIEPLPTFSRFLDFSE